MRTLSHYEVAWKMYQAKSSMAQIAAVIEKDRTTIWRWMRSIRRLGIKEFLRRKKTAKQRRPKSRTPESVIEKILAIRQQRGWCGQKIKKELKVKHGIAIGLSTIYRWLHARLEQVGKKIKRYKKHQTIVTADRPREVIEHDTVDLGGGVYAYTAIDIFAKEPSIFIGLDLTMETGARAFEHHRQFYEAEKREDKSRKHKTPVNLHQSDNGSEFQTAFREAVLSSGAKHRYSRPYKKNEQAHIENFNKALRSECFPGGEYDPKDIAQLQADADEFCRHYIEARWHMGLPEMMTPAEFKRYYEEKPEDARIALTKVYG